ncbi:intracellular protease, PfpI family protein [Acanthamoeba castellanii str. Neff]|uniref:Intracellular protease, PfpI family protein n=1 Tax=Acanthamoeba castellanii (strain ATCC 30010 / Neff) TaxID=1257118 RepID=L8GCZ7_ACACF|nr:intracellular protease, PfpI family protein [Acanthamoeba castellanii str. Neff]ELR10942.1 intracellular protease, PfpI family protein [Acanthamoeba castellanii str. Neff]
MSKGLCVVLVEDSYETVEFHYPRLRLEEAGYTVKAVGPQAKKVYQSKEGYWGTSDAVFSDINPAEVKALVAEALPECNKLVHDAAEAGAVVGFICHGAWVPISAKVVKGKKVTSHPAVQDDLVNAGAEWVDEPCVVDGKLVSAQLPKDLPAFMKAILNLLE